MMNLRTTQVDKAYQLTFYKDETLSVNCFLVEEDDGLTLIDTALPESNEVIIATADATGKPIRRIVLTHGHHDHVGALEAVHRAFPEATVHISAREARILSGDRALDPDEPDTPIRGSIPNNLQTRFDVLLHDGDRVGSLLALATPGHTPGSMSFLDARNRYLFAGDAFQITGGLAVAGQLRPAFPFPAMGTWSKERSLESARQLLRHRPACLMVGHGDMLRDPYEAMSRAIAEAEAGH